MNIFARLFTLLAIVSAFAFAETTSVSPVDSANSIQELEKKHAVWIKLEGDVEPSMFDFCARAIDDALKENPDYIVFEINTFGGRLDAAFDIVDTIMAIKGPETIALVKKKAISAGSLIALACKPLYCSSISIKPTATNSGSSSTASAFAMVMRVYLKTPE